MRHAQATTHATPAKPWRARPASLALLCALAAVLMLAGCGSSGRSGSSTAASNVLPALAGTFVEPDHGNAVVSLSGGILRRGSNDGTTGSVEAFQVLQEVRYPNAPAGYLIALNDAENPNDGGLYSVFDWVSAGASLYYCRSASALATQMDAGGVPLPDPSSTVTSGCGAGDGPWSQLVRERPPVIGEFDDDFMTHQVITPNLWNDGFGKYHIIEVDSAQHFLLARNDAANLFSPGLYSRFDWALSGGGLYYCQSAFSEATPDAARAVAAPDGSDPANGGCGGIFPWTGLGAAVSVYASRVLSYAPVIGAGTTAADWPYFFQPKAILGAPGTFTSVVSLGYDPAGRAIQGGAIAVGLAQDGDATRTACIVDGAGADFTVIENVFATTDATDVAGTYNEVATVEVSADGSAWYAFPASIDAAKPAVDPTRYTGLAGVLVDGDAFDLADVIAAYPGTLDATFRACYIRLRDGGTRYPDYGNTQSDLYLSGADLNAVRAEHFELFPGLSP
jgi:hypothetical protein